MAETIASPTDGTLAPAARAATRVQEILQTIEEQLTICRQTLGCAALALGHAEDEGFEGDEGLAAIRVVERCVDDLQQIEESLDRLEMRLRLETEQSQERIF